MDEFMLNKHKRRGNERRESNTRSRNLSADDSSMNLDTMWSVQNDLENDNFQSPSTSTLLNSNNKNSQKPNNIKDINFWKSVFFNNKSGDSYNDVSKTAGESIDMNTLVPSASSHSTSSAENHQSDRKTRKNQNHSSNTAILLNNIISNLNERRTKVSNDAAGETSSLTENDLVNSGLTADPSDLDSISLGSCKSSRKNNSGFHISSIESLLASTPSYTYLKTMKHKNLTPKRKNTVTSLSSHQGESDRFTAQNDLSTLFANNSTNSENTNRTRMPLSGASNFGNTSSQSNGKSFFDVCIKCLFFLYLFFKLVLLNSKFLFFSPQVLNSLSFDEETNKNVETSSTDKNLQLPSTSSSNSSRLQEKSSKKKDR